MNVKVIDNHCSRLGIFINKMSPFLYAMRIHGCHNHSCIHTTRS
uniref:Uncharacterized protein n=1 Tax=Anguilla anguilla TaxID=7936 RepID=A0A0E9VQF2_ANGAN